MGVFGLFFATLIATVVLIGEIVALAALYHGVVTGTTGVAIFDALLVFILFFIFLWSDIFAFSILFVAASD